MEKDIKSVRKSGQEKSGYGKREYVLEKSGYGKREYGFEKK